MEGKPGARNFGTVYSPVSLLILVLLSWNNLLPLWIAGAGILIMGWGDGLAAIVGESVISPWGTVFGARKSMAGTLTMFGTSFLVVFVLSLVFDAPSGLWTALYRAVGTALIGAFLEVSTPLGIDNLTVPLGTVLYLAFATPGTVNALVLIGFLFTIPVVFSAATADTWVGEMGVLHTQKSRHILTRQFVEPGVSGGVTVLGFFSPSWGRLLWPSFFPPRACISSCRVCSPPILFYRFPCDPTLSPGRLPGP